MRLLVVVQLLLPMVLIGFSLLSPPRSRWLWWLHLLTMLLLASALVLAGIWTVLPWWLPYLFGAVGRAALLRQRPTAASNSRQWLRALGLAVVALLGGWISLLAWHGHRPPAKPAVDLAWPLPPGRYLVVNGGTTAAVNGHTETMDLSVPRHRLFHGQSYGLDLVALNAAGRTTAALCPADPARYAIYGRVVRAPCPGTVAMAVDGVPDQPVPDLGPHAQTGNSVLLRCAGAEVLLAHFAPGSLRVRPGQRVATGQPLGAVGNSGASNEPHLHIHAQRPGPPGAPLGGRAPAIGFGGSFPVRNQRLVR